MTDEEDDFEYDGRDESPDPEVHDPNLYPKMPYKGTKKAMGGQAIHSKSP